MKRESSKFEIRNPKQRNEAESGFETYFIMPTLDVPDGSDGCLTGPDGLPDGSNFCKRLTIRKVDGLTGKIPPGALQPYPSPNLALKLSIGVRFLTVALFCLALPTRAATNISSGDDDLAKLRPPRGEIPPTFWERYNIWIIVGALVFLAVIGIIVWIVTRPKPPIIVPAEVRARQGLEPLLSQPEDGILLSKVSQILRCYIAETFGLQPGELTTTEFCRLIANNDRIGTDLATTISEFLRRCDERKFTPMPPAAPMSAAATALQFVEAAQVRVVELRRRAEQIPAA